MEGAEGVAYTYVYDREGHVTKVTDALGGRVKLSYDEAGQLIKETNQLGNSRSYTYTPLGNVERVTDEAGRTTDYTYLPGGQLGKVIHPDGTTESYTYDNNGNVTTFTNASGFTLSYTYDGLDRIIRIEGSEGERKEYSALLGRFYEEDLVKGDIILPKTQNAYKYALNQPLRYIDPTGLLEECLGEEENELRIVWEKYCEQIVENVSESVNWTLWAIDGTFSGIEVYNQISKHIPRFITNSNNKNLVNIADSVNYHGGRGGVRRISKSNLLTRNDELGRAYRTNRNLNRISKGLIVLNAGVSFVSEYNSNPNLSVKEKVVNSTVEAAWSVGSGVAIGAAVGSIVPGAGTIAGAAIGFVAGTIGSVIIDGVVSAKWFENGSKSVMDYAKQGANWAVDKVSEGLNSIGEVFSGFGDLVFG